MLYYASFFDLTLHYVGPFADVNACTDHAAACAAEGDGAVYKGPVSRDLADPSIAVSSPEDDLALIRSMQE